MLLDTVLRLHFLSDEMAVFIGDSEEEKEVHNFFGHRQKHKRFGFPCFQLSREMWENYGRPVTIEIEAREYVQK